LEDNTSEEGGEYFKIYYSVLLSRVSSFGYSDPIAPDSIVSYGGALVSIQGVAMVVITCIGNLGSL